MKGLYMKRIEVVAAIIIKDQKIFCTQRANQGLIALKWEFPGGKIEAGESREDALRREIREELNSEIEIERYFMTIEYPYESFHLTMHTYICSLVSGTLELKEHIASCFLEPAEIDQLDWAEADFPIVEKLKELVL
jgi:8-oxo-dGTP diphosphatase